MPDNQIDTVENLEDYDKFEYIETRKFFIGLHNGFLISILIWGAIAFLVFT